MQNLSVSVNVCVFQRCDREVSQQRRLCVSLTTELWLIRRGFGSYAAHQRGLQTGHCEPHSAAVWPDLCVYALNVCVDLASSVVSAECCIGCRRQQKVVCVVTYKWESEVTSLKIPSGSSEISLPWRDLERRWWKKWRGKTTIMCDTGKFNLQYWENLDDCSALKWQNILN